MSSPIDRNRPPQGSGPDPKKNAKPHPYQASLNQAKKFDQTNPVLANKIRSEVNKRLAQQTAANKAQKKAPAVPPPQIAKKATIKPQTSTAKPSPKVTKPQPAPPVKPQDLAKQQKNLAKSTTYFRNLAATTTDPQVKAEATRKVNEIYRKQRELNKQVAPIQRLPIGNIEEQKAVQAYQKKHNAAYQLAKAIDHADRRMTIESASLKPDELHRLQKLRNDASKKLNQYNAQNQTRITPQGHGMSVDEIREKIISDVQSHRHGVLGEAHNMAENLGLGLTDAGIGMYQMVRHPIKTSQDVVQGVGAIVTSSEARQAMLTSIKDNPTRFVGSFLIPGTALTGVGVKGLSWVSRTSQIQKVVSTTTKLTSGIAKVMPTTTRVLNTAVVTTAAVGGGTVKVLGSAITSGVNKLNQTHIGSAVVNTMTKGVTLTQKAITIGNQTVDRQLFKNLTSKTSGPAIHPSPTVAAPKSQQQVKQATIAQLDKQAEFFKEIGDWSNAENCYRQAIALQPSAHAWYSELEKLHFRRANVDEIPKMWQEAVAANPHDIKFYRSLAATYMRHDSPGQAEQLWLQGIAANPNKTPFYTSLAEHYRAQGKLVDAETYLLKAVDINPLDDVPYATIRTFYEQTNQAHKMEPVLLKAITLKPASLHLYTELANFYKDDLIKLEVLWQRGAEANPTALSFHQKLVEVYEKTGNFAAAEAAYMKIAGLQVSKIKKLEDIDSNYRSAKPEHKAAIKRLFNLKSAENVLHAKLEGPKGSNQGGFYMGKDGIKRYIKFYDDPAQACGEHLANQIYRGLGLEAPESMIFQHEGKFVYASNFLKRTQTLGDSELTTAIAREIMKGFAADVLTGNWDAIGLASDNILLKASGGVIRTDNGGTFLMRAQAGRKPSELLNQITEWDHFLNPSMNPSYARVAKAAGIKTVDDLKEFVIPAFDAISELRTQYGDWGKFVERSVPYLPDAEKKQVVQMLESRTRLLEDKFIDLIAPGQKPLTYSKVMEFDQLVNQKAVKGLPLTQLYDDIFNVSGDPNLNGFTDTWIAKWTSGYKEDAGPTTWREATVKLLNGKAKTNIERNFQTLYATRQARWQHLSEKLNIEAPQSFLAYRGVRGDQFVQHVAIAWRDPHATGIRVPQYELASWSLTQEGAKGFAHGNAVFYGANIPFHQTFADKWVDDHRFITNYSHETEIIAGGATKDSIIASKELTRVQYDGTWYTYADREELFKVLIRDGKMK